MNKPTLGLAALVIMSGATLAVAQDGPGERMPGPAQGLERGPASDGPRGDGPRADGPGAGAVREGAGDGVRERGRRAEGPNPAARTDPPKGEPSGAKREDGSAGRDGDRKVRQQSSDTDKGAKREKRDTSRADDAASKRDARGKSDDASGKKDAKAKSDTERGDRQRAKAERGKDADDPERAAKSDASDKASGRDKDQARQAERGRAAEGDRTAPEQVRKADLSGDKRERVGAALRGDRELKRRTDVDIDISVGTRLPRDWDYVPVPVAVIEIVPEYRGYMIVYVEDEYVITDPVTYEVVAVLPAEGGPRYAGGGGGGAEHCSETLTLTDDERDYIVRSIQITDEVDVSDITVGWSVPGEIELKTFPEPIVERSGELAACRYFISDDQIAIVDPEEDTVVLLIEHDD
ncbi:DUF1236 domain-containing protein [Hyphomicrobium sp. CS1GBMeth3]|uniref:DUF1236 domain-containing protein n=1 Tax=Hyphomicrobium sp. CS1GBMeth3 TaxID=1892845 RepID=UPI000A5D388B|nr:DUF1236 domain-containing protein [Hyphomicrobium sp. CS1GBMeth3]